MPLSVFETTSDEAHAGGGAPVDPDGPVDDVAASMTGARYGVEVEGARHAAEGVVEYELERRTAAEAQRSAAP
jgi:hypothetical protein